jgi:hypothetical protein
MESLLGPTLAAALLTIISFNWLFIGTVVGLFCSAALVLSVRIPQPASSERKGGIYENTRRGIRIYLATPRQRGLLALNLSVAAAGAMVIVNTIVIVRGLLSGTDSDVAIALACFGGGSMAAALMLPRAAGSVRRPRRHAAGGNSARDYLAWICSRHVRRVFQTRFQSCLAGPVARVDIAWHRLFGGHDALRPVASPLRAAGRPASGVCGAVCALSCLLAANVSAGGRGSCRPHWRWRPLRWVACCSRSDFGRRQIPTSFLINIPSCRPIMPICAESQPGMHTCM